MSVSIATWAERYVSRFGIAIVPIPPRKKGPRHEGWNTDAQLLSTPEGARRYYERHPRANMGACLEPSNLVSLDADHPEFAPAVLAAEGIDLDALIASTPTIVGRQPRLEFRAPPDVKLEHRPLRWPDPSGRPHEFVCVLELRAGRIQDVLPPSIHPATQKPYRWITPPRDGFPELPAALLALWLDFDAFARRARKLCPWAQPEPETTPAPAPTGTRPPRTGPSVIAAFNEAHSAVTILEAHGYRREGKRLRAPSSKTHGAGIRLLPDGRVRCYHWSDELGDGKPHDAFDLYTLFEHGGDQRAAVKTAAELLGMNRRSAA